MSFGTGCARLALVALVALCGVSPAKAHDTRPLYVEIAEKSPDVYSVSWKVPISVAATNVPNIELPPSCRALGPALGTASARSRSYTCNTDLSGESVAITYPRFNPSISTLMHLTRLSGESHSEVLPPDRAEWVVPDKENMWRVARDYTVLGIEHILAGYDHLLFIVCLILLAGTFRRMLVTITGFTIAHSITLAMAALGLVHVPVAAVEASVALSIVFVAYELARDDRHTLTWRHPIAVSSTFGAPAWVRVRCRALRDRTSADRGAGCAAVLQRGRRARSARVHLRGGRPHPARETPRARPARH